MGEKIKSIPISEYQPPYGENLPGFRPVDYIPRSLHINYFGNGLSRELFIHALSIEDTFTIFSKMRCEGRMTPLRELQMMRWMNVVTDKENWDVKVTMNRFLVGKGRR